MKDCRVKLLVEVEPELVENRFQEVLKDFQKSASLHGFRAGKAPLDLIEKRFIKEAHEEVVKSLVPEAYHQSLRKQNLTPVSLPAISEVEMTRGKKLTFRAEFDLFPEFSLKNYKGIQLTKPSMEVSVQETEKAMRALLDSHADLVPVETARAVAKGDVVTADIELWKDGSYVPGRQGVLLSVAPRAGDDFYEKILGAQIGEVREVTAGGNQSAYKICVRALREKKCPAFDDAFAKRLGKENATELREAIGKGLARYKKDDAFEKMKHELFQKLLTLVNFAVPESLVEKQKDKLIAQVRQQYEQMDLAHSLLEERVKQSEDEAGVKAKEQVKLYFILQKVACAEKIDPDETELERKLQSLADESKRPLAEVRLVFEDDLRESMRERRTIDFLLANAKLEEQTQTV